MSIGRISCIVLILIVTCHFAPRYVEACICTEPPPVDEAMDAAEIVFMGTVIAQDDEDPFASPGEFRRINLDVQISWKGISGTTVGVETPAGGAACGISSEIGQTLVVYGERLESSGRVVVTLCSRTGQLGGALQDTETLDELGITPLELTDGQDASFAPFDLEAGDVGDPTDDGGETQSGPDSAGRRNGARVGVCGTVVPIVPFAALGLFRGHFCTRRRTRRQRSRPT